MQAECVEKDAGGGEFQLQLGAAQRPREGQLSGLVGGGLVVLLGAA